MISMMIIHMIVIIIISSVLNDQKVVDHVRMVDRFEDPEFVSNIPIDQNVMVIIIVKDIPGDQMI